MSMLSVENPRGEETREGAKEGLEGGKGAGSVCGIMQLYFNPPKIFLSNSYNI